MTDTLMPAFEPETRGAFLAPLERIEWRKSGNGEDVTFTGSAIVYNAWSEPLWTPLGSFRERILPGALDQALANDPDVRLLLNHDESTVLARTKSGTLELSNEDDALRVWSKLDPEDPDVQRLRSKMRRGDIDQMSFAFLMDENRGAEDHWYEDEDGGILRDIVRVSELLDVSPVTFPAYEQTSAALRERELRTAIRAGKVAQPETDAAGNTATDAAQADPVDDVVSPLAALRLEVKAERQRERESYLRLQKELSKWT